jgi:hypothetical protein
MELFILKFNSKKLKIKKYSKTLTYFFSIFFLVAAIFHMVGVFYKINDSPPLRHLFFVFINLFCIFGLIKRPKFFIYFLGILLIQQFYSHGSDIITNYSTFHKIDWISILDISFLFCFFIFYLNLIRVFLI